MPFRKLRSIVSVVCTKRTSTIHCALLLLAFALNLHLLTPFPLREDEALYSYWALHLSHDDPWFLTVWPDKPPIFLWLQAGAFYLFGVSQATARLLSIMVTTATTALVAASSRRLWGSTGLVAATLFALNAFPISFAATAYTDPLLIFWGQLALALVLFRRYWPAGIALGAAIMTKQQGVLYIPLMLGMALTTISPPAVDSNLAPPLTTQKKILPILAILGGSLLMIGPIVYWDSLRWHVAPSPWDLGVRNYGALELAALTTWLPRAVHWSALLSNSAGTLVDRTVGGVVYAILALGALLAPRKPAKRALLLLVVWGGGFFLLHVVTTIQIWDRYLLPLPPIVALLLEGAALTIMQTRRTARQGCPQQRQSVLLVSQVVTTVLMILLLLPGALRAARGALPLGGDHGDYRGLTEMVEWLRRERLADDSKLPFVLYQQPLGWQLQFYLYEEQRKAEIDVRWFANPVTLADNAAKSVAQRRFLIQPKWRPTPTLPLHLATRTLTVELRDHFGMMSIYEILSQPQLHCAWCYCALPQPPSLKPNRPWPIWAAPPLHQSSTAGIGRGE